MTDATEFRNIIVDLPDWPGGLVGFYLLTELAVNNTEGFPTKSYELTLDGSGQGVQALPVPPSGAWLWRVTLPNGRPSIPNPTLAAGADLQLTTWLASAQSTETAASLVDQFAALNDFVAHLDGHLANPGDVINLPETTNVTPAAGDLWLEGGALHFQPATDERSINLANGVVIADIAVTNTVTETTVYTEPVSPNEFYKGSKWHVKLSGYYSTANSSSTFTMRMKVGGVTLQTFSSTAENVNNGFFRIEWFFTVRSTGVTGSIMSSVNGVFNATTKNQAKLAADTVDTTGIEDLTVTVQWSATNPNNTLTVTQGHVEILGVNRV